MIRSEDWGTRSKTCTYGCCALVRAEYKAPDRIPWSVADRVVPELAVRTDFGSLTYAQIQTLKQENEHYQGRAWNFGDDPDRMPHRHRF